MSRVLLAAAAGLTFGLGLTLSDMIDPARVLGFLDLFGAWDPTLAFVMGGAIIPMAIAWRLTANRRPAMGGEFPKPPEPTLGRNLVLGSVLFGMGWGLAGLCPGPSIASISYGGLNNLIFIAAMVSGMLAAPHVRRWLDTRIPAEMPT